MKENTVVNAYNDNSGIRRLFQEGVSLSGAFNAEVPRGTAEHDSGQRAGQSNVGQISEVGLRPYSLEEKLLQLKRMIARGDVALSAQVSMETIRHELQRPEHDGLGVRQMAAVLEAKKLTQKVKSLQNKMKHPVLAMAF